MGIGEAPSAKIRHGIGLAPDDVVQNPEAHILHQRADTENIVIGADDENGCILFHHAPRRAQPVPAEGIIGGKILEFVPVIIHGIDKTVVGAVKLALKLQIIGRIGKNQIDRAGWQRIERGDAVTQNNFIFRE